MEKKLQEFVKKHRIKHTKLNDNDILVEFDNVPKKLHHVFLQILIPE